MEDESGELVLEELQGEDQEPIISLNAVAGWEIVFSAPDRILKHEGCDMVVGVDLLIHLGPMTFDFKKHKVQFKKDGNRMELQGIEP
ncbi:hypothetical protein ACS0TY_021281 [Phlomoides rotata]